MDNRFSDVLQKSSATVRKKLKNLRWRRWAVTIHKRKHKGELIVAEDSCAYKGVHVVATAEPFGGGYRFRSLVCDGCEIGRAFFSKHKKLQSPPCALLLSPLFTTTAIKVGDIVDLK
jgi:hypothetical protein